MADAVVLDPSRQTRFHQRTRPWSDIKQGLDLPVINQSAPERNGLQLIPEKQGVLPMSFQPVMWQSWGFRLHLEELINGISDKGRKVTPV